MGPPGVLRAHVRISGRNHYPEGTSNTTSPPTSTRTSTRTSPHRARGGVLGLRHLEVPLELGALVLLHDGRVPLDKVVLQCKLALPSASGELWPPWRAMEVY